MTSSLEIGEYLRVAAYAIAFFDYLQTIPAEFRLYSRQRGLFQLSPACILFILVRYLGLLSIIVGNTGFFYHGFTEASCRRYFWLTPIFKLFLYMASQAILALRTYAVSRKSPLVLYGLIVLFIVTLVPELISTFMNRVPFMNNGTCTSGNPPGIKLASLYYAGGLAFDVVTMIVSFIYLFKFSHSATGGTSISQLARIMFEDGIAYFVALTAMNIVNIIFFQSSDTTLQPSASTLGMAATMIFSARFILNLFERGRDHSDQSHSSRHPQQRHIFRNNLNTTTTGEYPEILISRSVEITMDDFVQKRDSPSTAKHEWAENESIP